MKVRWLIKRCDGSIVILVTKESKSAKHLHGKELTHRAFNGSVRINSKLLTPKDPAQKYVFVATEINDDCCEESNDCVEWWNDLTELRKLLTRLLDDQDE